MDMSKAAKLVEEGDVLCAAAWELMCSAIREEHKMEMDMPWNTIRPEMKGILAVGMTSIRTSMHLVPPQKIVEQADEEHRSMLLDSVSWSAFSEAEKYIAFVKTMTQDIASGIGMVEPYRMDESLETFIMNITFPMEQRKKPTIHKLCEDVIEKEGHWKGVSSAVYFLWIGWCLACLFILWNEDDIWSEMKKKGVM